jgi:hypothetical protein
MDLIASDCFQFVIVAIQTVSSSSSMVGGTHGTVDILCMVCDVFLFRHESRGMQ